MLGKLIKYDLKALAKILAPLWGVLLVMGLIFGISIRSNLDGIGNTMIVFSLVVIVAVVGLLNGIYHIYAAMVIGQLSNGNRFLFAFVAYAGLSIIVSLIGIPSMTNLDNMGSSLQNTFGFDGDLWIYLVENIVIIIVYHIVTEVILTKKLNLE